MEIASLADQVWEITEGGRLVRKQVKSPNEINNVGLKEKNLTQPGLCEKEHILDETAAWTGGGEPEARGVASKVQHSPSSESVDKRGKTVGDRDQFQRYFQSVGMVHSLLFVAGAIVWAVVFKFGGQYTLHCIPTCHKSMAK